MLRLNGAVIDGGNLSVHPQYEAFMGCRISHTRVLIEPVDQPQPVFWSTHFIDCEFGEGADLRFFKDCFFQCRGWEFQEGFLRRVAATTSAPGVPAA